MRILLYKVTCAFFFLAKDFANRWTVMVLLYSEAFYNSREKIIFLFLFKTKIESDVPISHTHHSLKCP